LATYDSILVAGRPWRASARRLALIAALAALVGALALCLNRAHNGDVYLQLLGGRFIAQHGFALHDPFPTIAAGQPWNNQQWLSELAMYGLTRVIGLTGLTVAYALLLAAPLLALLLRSRHQPPAALVAGAALYFPALLAIIHPRAAGFTLACFSLLAILLMRLDAVRPWRLVAAVAVLFALWTNLHGGFVSGLALIALVLAGTAIDRARGLAGADARALRVLAVAGAAALAATFATPLGPKVWSYVVSFSNPALPIASTEWEPATQSAPALVYLALCAGFAGVLFRSAERPRRLTPLLVTAGFVVATVLSLRNIILIPAALFFQIGALRPSRARAPLAIPLAAAGATLAAAVVWAVALGPARTPEYLASRAVSYALRHPPRHGRLAALAGIGSYLLWREPRTRVVIDGWLEHFTAAELRDTYAVLRGLPGAEADLARLRIGAVITRHDRAVRLLEAHGFVVVASSPTQGKYLVRGRTR
jgi:hypothetical protein